MISTPTVLVLGAGASMHLGYPSGRDLVDWIVKTLGTRKNHQLFQHLNFPDSDIIAFREALSYSGRPSVDAFLEHRKEFIGIGKIAIAQSLIPKETLPGIFKVKNHWYEYLFQKLNTTFEEFSNNTLSIITFNYDRSLETYLFTALQSSYGKSGEEVSQVISQIPIIHVYGKLGDLPWQDTGGREYGATENPSQIEKSATGVKIISEDIEIDKDPEFIHARNVLEDANRIYFLGFGYNATNMTRLNIRWDKSANRIIGGSCYGFSGLEKDQLSKSFDHKLDLGMPGEDVLSFLRERTTLV